jgi:UDP-2,3-diacylglucosamine pyrophosphatase LpxH
MSAQTKHQIVVLSDIHIADDAPTVWYQSTIHNPYLEGICSWVIANAGSVRELVLLGDVVDFWTHRANVQPPSFAQIVAAQPEIFGPKGYFCQVLDALDGAVTYVPGNHDMGVTAADVAAIVSAGGHAMKFADSVYYPLGAGDQRIALAHGNAYTMFNAPDANSPWASLPVGHFVTRMVASKWARDLPPGHTVASLPGQGSPNGIDVSAVVKAALMGHSFAISGALLDSVAAQTGTPSNQTFVLPSGQVVALDTDVHPAYDNLFSNWVAACGGGAIGYLVAGKSALADALAYYMGWFAQRQAFQSGSQVIVLGHTHMPISGVNTTLIGYANSGFECPSTADMPPQVINFVVIDTNSFATQVMQSAAGGTQILPYNAPTTPIVELGEDYSSYVIIENSGQDNMVLVGAPTATSGYWVVPPPQTILPGTRVTLWLQDYPGPVGTEGSVSYQSPSRGQQMFKFECPTLSWNSCSGGASFRTKSASANWGAPGSVAHMGHPFYVDFIA